MGEKSINERQQAEIKKLQSQVQKLNMKLQENEKFKSHFLSNIRNALVNPFSSVIGLSGEIIKSDFHDWKRVIKLAALIHSEAFDLDFQLKNIFCTAEIESGEKHPEIYKMDIKELISDCIESFSNLIRKRDIKITLDASYEKRYFYTDPSIVNSILRNLIHNAILYGGASKEIKIQVVVGDALRLKVADNGDGMSDKDINIVFDRFKRLSDQLDSISSGHGLGLPIVKNLVEMMEGEISIKSKVNEGTELVIILPEQETSDLSAPNEINEASSEAYLF